MQEKYSLHKHLSGFDWFHSIATDSYGRYVVYVQYMNQDVLSTIPDSCDGKQVLVHFVSSITSKPEQYSHPETLIRRAPLIVQVPTALQRVHKQVQEEKEECNDLDLSEIDSLMNGVIGKDALLNVFYEIHDQDDAVTSVSESFPEVRKKLESLYNTYGFDVLYDILEHDEQ